ncbi:hypothetical protein HPQ32_11970 [Photobacterium carnosum]|uniref:hypothetical protein n=1 Tax=Photobacterium carnosum TaxID=2023717 RepID=UPI001C913762|nr:hypothetical protein [Photobacterium carnosum]MBY3789148.1 hypothetical protein [Photobacterium carnosum]MCD9534207.1 hypothetical protein [Photobacterium carnosum]
MNTKITENHWVFNDFPIGSIERFVECSWSLSMLRFHIEENKITSTIKNRINNHNKMKNISVLEFDLKSLVHTYRTDTSLNDALEEKETLVWLWFNNSQELINENFAGWLRSKLTVRDFYNIRCVFVIKKENINKVFFDYLEPLYLSSNNILKYFDY